MKSSKNPSESDMAIPTKALGKEPPDCICGTLANANDGYCSRREHYCQALLEASDRIFCRWAKDGERCGDCAQCNFRRDMRISAGEKE